MEKCVFSSSRSNSLRGNLHRLLRIDVVDHRKFRGRQGRQAEAAAACFDDDLLAFDGQATPRAFPAAPAKYPGICGPER